MHMRDCGIIYLYICINCERGEDEGASIYAPANYRVVMQEDKTLWDIEQWTSEMCRTSK